MLKKIGLAAALTAASVSANAAWDANGFEGELILNVWNNATETSFSMDLGIDASYGPLDSNNLTFTIDSAAMTHVGGSAADLMWNVGGANSDNTFNGFDLAAVPLFGLYTTSVTAPLGGYGSNYNTVAAVANGSFANLDTALAGGTELVAGAADPTILLSGGSYAGNTAVFGSTSNTVQGAAWMQSSTAAAAGDSLYAYKLGVAFDQGAFSEVITQSAAVWTFDADASTLTYGSVAAVPVPAAVWMFASGLLGMAGVARRKKA
jgi:hypothetical protein